jgi:hypothetical protein
MKTAQLYNLRKAEQIGGHKMMLEISNGDRYPVKGKREANKVCKALNVKPWNF